jgi:hypothetical protein
MCCYDRYLPQGTDAGEILNSESPLIRNLYNSLNVKTVKPLNENGMMYLVSRIVRLSGIRKAFQFKGEAKRALGFRKFYKTQAERSGMKSINVEVAHGVSIGVSDHYYRPKDSDILQDYISHAADALSIDPTQRLQRENQELKSEQVKEIAGLKQAVDEDPDYDKPIAYYKHNYPSVYDLQFLQQNMFVIPVPFSKEHKHMLAHCKEMIEYHNGQVAIHPKHNKLIISLRTAVENGEGMLDKDATSHDDLFDAFRLSLQFWH